MKKLKEEKGITLVALIITIVVLLILAAVAIGTIKNSDIIGYAKNAAGSFNQAKNNELDELAKYEAELDKYAPGEKVEYIGNLRLNTKYFASGNLSGMYLIFYKDGKADYVDLENNENMKVEYIINNDIVTVLDTEFRVIKDENDMLLNEKVGLFATTSKGLRYFEEEEYINDGAYTTNIILKNNGFETKLTDSGAYSSTGVRPVFYKGTIYGINVYIDSDNNDAIVISTDNCETLNVNGIIYTKITE